MAESESPPTRLASVEAGEHAGFVANSSSKFSLALFGALGLLVGGLQACSAGNSDGNNGGNEGSGGNGQDSLDGVESGNDSLDGLDGVDSTDGGTDGNTDDPTTCAQAASNRTYVGCEFWPTITYNPVYSDFDFAVVLANGGTADATVTVTGNGQNITETVPAGGLKAITLPWVAALKGPEFSRTNTSGGRATSSVLAAGTAYKVVSSVPVTAWQFNPLQYKKPIGEISGGCGTQFGTQDCFSASNDATLLLPTTAMTKAYRAFTRAGINGGAPGPSYTSATSGVAITATKNGTTVTVQLSPTCAAGGVQAPTVSCLAAGTGVTAGNAGDTFDFAMNEGDVLQLLGVQGAFDGEIHADLSGSIVNATEPVQVIGFNPITNIPDIANADHIEEIVLPGEVLGKEYIVTVPTSPSGVVKGGHVVRFFGNVDGTALTYEAKPAGAPDTLNAGDVVEIGPITAAFKVSGNQPFSVGSFMIGGAGQGDGACPNYPCSGDPSYSTMVTPEQFRSRYTFLAPVDYDKNYADILVPDGATVMLDGVAVTAGEPVVAGWALARVLLDGAAGGAHKLEATAPVGLQVMGFGHASSYYYPGGLNLKIISEPPVVVR